MMVERPRSSADVECGTFEDRVESTNTEASQFKAAVVRLGYYKDPYVELFVGRPKKMCCTTEMCRGYYVRVKGIRTVVCQFVDTFGGQAAQLVNLGAGFDTLFWNLRRKNRGVRCYVEADFPNVFYKKRELLKRFGASLFATDFKMESAGKEHIRVGPYNLFAVDLREIDQLEAGFSKVHNLDFASPTLILFECVLMYMRRQFCQRLLSFLAKTFPNALLLCYEPTGSDRFIDVFQENMNQRGLPVPGLKNFADETCLLNMLQSSGWHGIRFCTANDFMVTNLRPKSAARISKLQPLVDPELLTQLLNHYMFLIASTGENLEMDKIGFTTTPPD